MSNAKKIRIGTLGSAATFAGEATRRLRELHPEFSEAAYFPSMDDCWEELKKGTIDAVILGAERSGQPHHGGAVVADGFHVIAELAQPLKCSLYAKPGTRKSDIRRITGHGSIRQCAAYLDREFAGIPREAHGLNSVEAARAVMAGDGTLAVVGSASLPDLVGGLAVLDREIDDGAVASWWAVSRAPALSEVPEVVVVVSRCGPDGQLGKLIAAIGEAGYALRTAAAFPVHAGVSVYDYLLTFDGKGTREAVEQAISRFKSTRLAGAFDQHG